MPISRVESYEWRQYLSILLVCFKCNSLTFSIDAFRKVKCVFTFDRNFHIWDLSLLQIRSLIGDVNLERERSFCVIVQQLTFDSKDSYVTGFFWIKSVNSVIKLNKRRQTRRKRVLYVLGIWNWQGIICLAQDCYILFQKTSLYLRRLVHCDIEWGLIR